MPAADVTLYFRTELSPLDDIDHRRDTPAGEYRQQMIENAVATFRLQLERACVRGMVPRRWGAIELRPD